MKKMSKILFKLIVFIVIISIILSTVGCSPRNSVKDTRIITDITGDEVEIPNDVNSVLNLVIYGCQMMVSLGMGDYLIGINEETIESQWIEEMYPRLAEIKNYSEEASVESLMNSGADLIIVEHQERARELRAKGLTAITFTYYTIDELKQNVRILGEILGGNAEKKCNEYIEYLDANIALVHDALSGKLENKESLYYINGVSNKGLYKTTGKGSTNSLCAELSYTEYATDSLIEAPANYVDSEAILAQNPENIIIGGVYQHVLYKELFENQEWEKIAAVKNGQVFKVPMGISAWNRYGIELALMIPWTASVVYPEYFEYDVVNETIDFYKRFTEYELSVEQANYIIKGLTPNGEKEIAE